MARLLAALLSGLLLLSGCGGAEEPKPSPTASPTKTSTTPPVPVMPEAAKANTKAGAEAFVRYYVLLLNAAQLHGLIDPLTKASDADCTSCSNVMKSLTRIYEAGGSVRGGEWTIRGVTMRPPKQGVSTGFLDISSTRQIVEVPGQARKNYPAGAVRYAIAIKWANTSWKVAGWSGV